MFIVGNSFFSETLSKLNIKTTGAISVIDISSKVLSMGATYKTGVVPLGVKMPANTP